MVDLKRVSEDFVFVFCSAVRCHVVGSSMAVTVDAMIEPKTNLLHLDRNLFIFFYGFTEPFCVITFLLFHLFQHSNSSYRPIPSFCLKFNFMN